MAAEDKTYTELLALIQSLVGAETLTSDEQSKILEFVNRRAYEAYQTSPSWTRYFNVSQPFDLIAYTLSGATSSTSTSVNQNYKLLGSNDGDHGLENSNIYQGATTASVIIYKNASNQWIVATGATTAVQGDGRYRITVSGTNQFTEGDTDKKSVLENVVVWTPRSGSDSLAVLKKNLVPWGTVFGDFIRIHRSQAFVNDSSIEYDFYVDSEGAHVLNLKSDSENQVYITYKGRLPTFTTGSSDIPREFFYFIAHAAFADFLRLESKYEDARVEEAIAQNYLALELEKIDIRSNNNQVTRRFSTYVNRQSR
jgi:hypothetical protein